jgi:hypothetical protein
MGSRSAHSPPPRGSLWQQPKSQAFSVKEERTPAGSLVEEDFFCAKAGKGRFRPFPAFAQKKRSYRREAA